MANHRPATWEQRRLNRFERSLRVHYGSHSPATVDDYVHDAGIIWEPQDKFRSVIDLWLHIVDHASRLGEALRRQIPETILGELADLTLWLFGFCAKLQQSKTARLDRLYNISTPLSDMIWNKYPHVCPACFGRAVAGNRDLLTNDRAFRTHFSGSHTSETFARGCTCLMQLASVEVRNERMSGDDKRAIQRRLREYAVATRNKKPTALPAMEAMFERIYYPNIFVYSLENIGFHLLEEVGEVTKALVNVYTYDKTIGDRPTKRTPKIRCLAVEEELADVFSWIFALSIKIKTTFAELDKYLKSLQKAPVIHDIAMTITLEQLIWNRYGDKRKERLQCFGCESVPCKSQIVVLENR